MASSDLRKELECSVCLNIYTDPVTLRCGHNFCRDCIGRVLDTQEGSGGYSCPECREEFQERPALHRNITLRNIVENFQSTHPEQEESGVFCTHCIHTPVPAVKSCLLCEASLCDNHLRVHSKSPEHVLCDPTTSLKDRKCSIHKKILEYYCTEDSKCICVSCSLVGEHRGHQVETLEEASEMKKKKLRNVLQKLMTEREEMEKRIQSLQEHGRKVQEKADDETKRVAALFRDLNRCLEDLEKRVLSEISGQVERLSLSMSDMIQQLEIKKEELSRKMGDIEELCNITDPLTVLQESDTGDLCDTEDGEDEDRERHEKHLHVRGDLDVAGISHTIHTGLSDIMSGVNVHICTGIHVSPHSTTEYEGHIKEEPSSPPSIQCSDHQAGGPNIVVVQQTWGVSGVTDILPEVKTAGNRLHLSDDGKTVSGTSHQTLLETSGRFWSSQKSDTGDLCDTEGGDDEKLLHDGGDLDVVGISHTLHTGLFDIMSGVNVQECTGTHIYPHSTTKDEGIINAEPSRKRLRFTPTIQHSHMEDIGPNIGVVQQTLGVSEVTDMLLDVRTAGNYLLISDDGKTASSSSHQNLPETPERFQCPQVISSQIFSSGRHYWEVDVGGSIYWKVGMCYPSIDRRGVQSWIGFNRKSWGLERLWGDEYLVIHDRKETPLPGRVSSNRVRIDLDYEAGRISFYELCDPIRHLHTFTTTFTEPLQAGLGVWKGFIKISGGDQM